MTEVQHLPPGWECKYDANSGKPYYINHITKTSTWEDPRVRYIPLVAPRVQSVSSDEDPRSRYIPLGGHRVQSVSSDEDPRFRHIPLVAPRVQSMSSDHRAQSEHIPLQHGSPDMRRNYVYPSQPSPIPAFQMPGQYSPKFIPLQEMRNSSRMSPLLVRTARTQDSTLTNVPDTDESVAKISSMFPTVSDTHIRLLLKKYHNREAVVISALQVEKHPITTPGPFATPPPSRNIHPALYSSLQMTPPLGPRTISRGDSPVLRYGSITTSVYTDSPRIGEGFRNSPRYHSSPKLKLRYMKSIFPKAEEIIILDILSNNDNNIQKTSDALKQMGYERKDPAKVLQQQAEAKVEEQKAKEQEQLRAESALIPKIKTTEEKVAIKTILQEKYKDIAERVISIALESVQYDENRANQILQIMVQEDSKAQSSSTEECQNEAEDIVEIDEVDTSATVTTSQSRQSLKSLLKSDKFDTNKEKSSFSRVIEETNDMSHYKSPHLLSTYGADRNLANGANDKLLLLDYVSWQGPDPDKRIGPKMGLAQGPDKTNVSIRSYVPNGPNPGLFKGPKFGLAKGSIFHQLRNTVAGESRGK